ncbi:hypothetical protein V6N13_058600 [Hibiscus sabdariffa]|uniref:Uncharacterized protein n=1 Tax=Hibiscus sabdariffa TaxID=183260 RepID=A0ABR2GFQ3_9ROSI
MYISRHVTFNEHVFPCSNIAASSPTIPSDHLSNPLLVSQNGASADISPSTSSPFAQPGTITITINSNNTVDHTIDNIDEVIMIHTYTTTDAPLHALHEADNIELPTISDAPNDVADNIDGAFCPTVPSLSSPNAELPSPSV